MGSEGLSHKFALEDPTFKEDSSSTKHANKKSSTQHSLSHTSGTQPVSVSNGPTSSSSIKIKHQPKTKSKYKKLIKLYHRQLSHISTTLNAIESLAKTENNQPGEMLLSSRKRVDQLSENLDNFRNSPMEQDHIHFDPLKNDIDQLVNDLKSYKVNNNNPDLATTLDSLVSLPLDVSDSENDEENGLVYF